jgi:hypothetical protein
MDRIGAYTITARFARMIGAKLAKDRLDFVDFVDFGKRKASHLIDSLGGSKVIA